MKKLGLTVVGLWLVTLVLLATASAVAAFWLGSKLVLISLAFSAAVLAWGAIAVCGWLAVIADCLKRVVGKQDEELAEMFWSPWRRN